MADEKRGRVLLHPSGVGRREILQGLFAGGASMALPGAAAAETAHHMAPAVAEAQAKAKAPGWKPEFLDAHQFATLTALCARIVPGSEAAQADRFIDALLVHESNDRQRRFLSAMGALEGEARTSFGKPFKSLTEAQQVEILTKAATAEPGQKDETWAPGTLLPEPDENDEREQRRPRLRDRRTEVVTLRDHFDRLKGWIVDAYYSSEAGLKELGYTGQAFFAEFPDCKHPEHNG